MSEESFICTSCNADVSENAKFCPECGEKLDGSKSESTEPKPTIVDNMSERVGEWVGKASIAVPVILLALWITIKLWYIVFPAGIAWLWFKTQFKYKKHSIIALSVLFVLLVLGAVVPKVEYKTITDNKEIPYKTITEKDPKIVEGGFEIKREGVLGILRITYKNKYVNGKLDDQTKIKEKIIKKPIDEIKLIGTLPKEVKIKEAEGYYNTAMSLFSQAKYDESLSYIQKAIDAYPGTYQVASDKKAEIENKIAGIKAEKARLAAIQKEQQEITNYKKSCRTISYKELERDADSLIGENVYYKGQVFTVQVSDSKSVVQLNVTNKGYGYWSDQIFLEYPGKIDVFKDDIIQIWGTVAGKYSYESVAGYNITVPSVLVKYYSK